MPSHRSLYPFASGFILDGLEVEAHVSHCQNGITFGQPVRVETIGMRVHGAKHSILKVV